MMRHHPDVGRSRHKLICSGSRASDTELTEPVLYKSSATNLATNHLGAYISTSPVLNPQAMEFAPSSPQRLPSIKEEVLEEEIDIIGVPYIAYCRNWQSRPLCPAKRVLRSKYVIFIPRDPPQTNFTEQAIQRQLFHEHFATANDLFYHLRYQCRMQVIDGLYKLFTSAIDGQELVIFNTELHTKHGRYPVYIIGIPNDQGKKRTVKWKMAQFMTAQDIYETYNIDTLPSASRPNLYRQTRHNMQRYQDDINKFKKSLNTLQMKKNLMNVGQIRSEKKWSQPLIVTPAELVKCIKDAIEHNAMRPIVWFDKNKRKPMYRIQMLLPIELVRGNWIGLTFDYNENNELYLVKFCVDDTDIRRKLVLFRPSHDANAYQFFSNEIREINITNAETKQFLWEQNQFLWRQNEMIWSQNARIKELEDGMRDKDVQIETLKRRLII